MQKKQTLKILGILFLAFLVWRIISLITKNSDNNRARSRESAVAVEVDSIEFSSIEDVRQFTGTIHPLYQYIISPKVSGRIVLIRKRIGDWVERGEIVAKIDNAEYQQAVREAEANLKIAQAALVEAQIQMELVKQELERVQSLQQKGIASPSELDAALTNNNAQQSRLKLAHAQVEQRQASLKSANIRLGYTILAATEPGFIGERFVDEGTLLAPNAPVVSVIGIDTVIVKTTIIERDYGHIFPGQMTEVQTDAFPSERFYGKVSRIAPMLQEASRVAQMEIEVANDSLLLKPGMFTKVNVVLSKKDSTQIVPREAVVSREGENGVFIVEIKKSIARYYPVILGIETPEKAEIISPKLEGLVVTLGQHLLEDGSPVIISKDDNYSPQSMKKTQR